MIEHFAMNLCRMYEQMTLNIQSLAGSAEPTSELHPDYKKAVARTGLQRVIEEDKRLGFGPSVMLRAQMLHDLLLQGQERYTSELLLKDLEAVMMEIVIVLSKRKFAYIPPPNDQYFEKEKLFGAEVYEKFEDARQDLKDAGNCLAASLPTASVFHLMRVAEHGLRKLARKLRVRLTHTGKPCPVEFGDWEKIITAIRNKITEARKLPAGPKRQAKLEAYSNAADHCEYMRDIWRNNMAHTRKPYLDAEALGVLERVRDFMIFLGMHL